MTANKYFIDTSPFIYILENNPEFYAKTFECLYRALKKNALFYTSVITFNEYCVKPEISDRKDLITDFEDLLEEWDVYTNDITAKIAKKGAKLRAKYAFLKGMDSLQIASALEIKCDVFLTNDKRLKEIQEIKVVLISSL